MTDPYRSEGAKAPPKPFTTEQYHRKIRSFVLRRAAATFARETFQRVATRKLNAFAGYGLHVPRR